MSTTTNTKRDADKTSAELEADLEALVIEGKEFIKRSDAENKEIKQGLNQTIGEINETIAEVEQIYTDLDEIEKKASDDFDALALKQAEELAAE